jgi:N-acetylglucosamine-6-sulfatase
MGGAPTDSEKNIMNRPLLKAAMFLLATNCLCITIASRAEAAKGACAQIRKVCQDAGFVQGGVKEGNGLQADCIKPILQGTPGPRKASKPLPRVPAETIAACKVENPDFGEARAGRAPSESASAGAASALPVQPLPLAPGASRGPNIVFILADDFSMDLIAQKVFADSMPNLKKMQSEGVTFANYFVTDSLCCPSRSSIFTGKLPHNTGVFRNQGSDGGYKAFVEHGNEPHTFAVALHGVGYRTAMLGKYLNGYAPEKNGIPQGWSEWDVDGQLGYGEYNYFLNENGKVQKHPEYLTDEISKLGQAFIRQSGMGAFFIELATFAPHAPYVPPARYLNDFPTLTYDKASPFGARPDASAPDWLQHIPPLTQSDINAIDAAYRNRLRSIKAIDDMIGEVRALLGKLQIDKNTYIVFSSDNGYHMGEYSLRPGKMTPLDTDIHVPLIIAGPGVAAGRIVNEIAENIDLCPTFTELAGTDSPTTPDGHSLTALLRPDYVADPNRPWRREALIEHHHPGAEKSDPDLPEPSSGNPPTYEALRSSDVLYVEYGDTKNEVGFYDLKSDPFELHNIAVNQPPAVLKQWHEILHANAMCNGAEECWHAQQLMP